MNHNKRSIIARFVVPAKALAATAAAALMLTLTGACKEQGGQNGRPRAELCATSMSATDGMAGRTPDQRGRNYQADRRNTDAPTAQRGQMRYLEMPMTSRGERIIRHTGYALSFNTATNCPNWVAWELTRKEAKARGSRNPDFYPDPQVGGRSQVTTDDYRGSGYTRGHMCPSADMRWSQSAQHDCFYMTNMCPQRKELNADSWELLERSCRRWAEQEGSVYIVCGPVFNPDRKPRFIGRSHRVQVPDGFFKVVLSLRRGHEKAIGFYYANNDRFQTMESASMSVDEVERMTGYDFFYQLEDRLETRLERRQNLRAWE